MRAVVKGHRGTITAESPGPDRGSTFTITPARRSLEPEAEADAASEAALCLRVLLVEDEAHLAQGIRFNLELEGYDVESIGDGLRAFERLAPPRGAGVGRGPAIDLVARRDAARASTASSSSSACARPATTRRC